MESSKVQVVDDEIIQAQRDEARAKADKARYEAEKAREEALHERAKTDKTKAEADKTRSINWPEFGKTLVAVGTFALAAVTLYIDKKGK